LCDDGIVSYLKMSDFDAVSKVSQNFYKFRWDENFSSLKQKSIDAHFLWIANSSPRYGDFYNITREAKYRYVLAISDKGKADFF